MKTILIVNLFLVVFSLADIVNAQPQCPPKFNPFNICQYEHEKSDYIFYGEIKYIERFTDVFDVGYENAYFKVTVKVIEPFNGNMPHQVEVYLSQNFICDPPLIKNKYIFKALKMKLNSNESVYFTNRISRSMSKYSSQGVNDVFEHIRSVINKDKKDYVGGVVVSHLRTSRKVPLEAEAADRLIFDVRNYEPLANILINAISEQTGKVYRARTKADGSFRIQNIPYGNYKIQLGEIDKKQIEPYLYGTDGTACTRRWKIAVYDTKSN